jgi:hypothetical protein
MIAHYERAREVKIADAALASPSDAERARQARMKREGQRSAVGVEPDILTGGGREQNRSRSRVIGSDRR